MAINSDELVEQLGDDFYEAKRMVGEGFFAYSVEERAFGKTLKEALQNLLKLVNDRNNNNG